MRAWQTEELEIPITWMKENHKRFRGKPADCINGVKEDVLSENEGFKHVRVQKVRDKYGNLKRAWKDAKTMQEQSGFGIREEDCERPTNGIIKQGSSPSLP